MEEMFLMWKNVKGSVQNKVKINLKSKEDNISTLSEKQTGPRH